jgi:DUF4097 and DUF4098 domain-containing protein YvlB
MGTLFLFVLMAGVPGMLTPSFAGSGSYRDEFHQTYAFDGHGRVTLENIYGDVRITAWDRNEVQVDAAKRASTQDRLDDARIVVDAAQASISIRTHYPGPAGSGKPAAVDYMVKVPRTARLDQVKVVNGTLEIFGMQGEVRASSVSGAIRTHGLAGDVKLSTVSGRLEAVFDEIEATRSISVNSVSGAIELLLPMDAAADLQADTVSGGISSDFGQPTERGHFPGRHWSAALKGGGARIRVSNVNGSISLAPAWHGRRVKFT